MKKTTPQEQLQSTIDLPSIAFRVRALYEKYWEIKKGIIIANTGQSVPVRIVDLSWEKDRDDFFADDPTTGTVESSSEIIPELWDRCPLVLISLKKPKHKKNNMANKKKPAQYILDQQTGKPLNISFTYGEVRKEFGIYSMEDVEANYKHLELKMRFQFGLDVIFAEAHRAFWDFNMGHFFLLPEIKESVFRWIYDDSTRTDSYPNFIEACTLTYEGLGGEIIHTHKRQASLIAFDEGSKKTFSPERVQFHTGDIVKLMKEYADYYSREQVNSKIKFWKENRTYAIQNLKTELKKIFAESIQAELDLLEEYRKDSELSHRIQDAPRSHQSYFPYLKFLREDQDKILFESLTKCDLLKKIDDSDRYIFNGPVTGLATTTNKLVDLEFISEAFTNTPFIKQFVDRNGEEIIESNFSRYRERAKHQQGRISKRIAPLFELLIDYDNKARKMG